MWFKVDDNLAFHPKVMQAGLEAMGLWVRTGAWCAQQLTDGFVPHDVVRTMGGNSATRAARRLVEVRLWLEVDGGYLFHQWGQDGRQPSRSEVEARREADRKRKADARAARAAKGTTS